MAAEQLCRLLIYSNFCKTFILKLTQLAKNRQTIKLTQTTQDNRKVMRVIRIVVTTPIKKYIF